MVELNITKEKINTLIKIRGQNTELTDEGFNILLNYTLNNTLNYLGIKLEPTTYTEKSIYNQHNPTQYLVQHYPITEILECNITNQFTDQTTQLNINTDLDYDKNTGIIKLKKHNIKHHTITITYTATLPDSIISQLESIITDMILLNTLPNNNGNITSMSEGDLSISYNADHTLASNIQKRLDDLKNNINTKISLI